MMLARSSNQFVKRQSTERTCNEDICSHFIRNYKRSNFYEQIRIHVFRIRRQISPGLLEDTVEFFNIVQQLRLNGQEKSDLVAFLRAL